MEERLNPLLLFRTKKVDMTPIKLDGDDDDEEEDAGDDDDDDDDESTPVPPSKRRTATVCVLLRLFLGELQINPPVRNSSKSRSRQQEEEDDEEDGASEPADSILDSESEGEETTEVDGLLDDE